MWCGLRGGCWRIFFGDGDTLEHPASTQYADTAKRTRSFKKEKATVSGHRWKPGPQRPRRAG